MNKCLVILLVFLSSCYSEKKASLHLAKAQGTYPHVVAANCANFYPSRDSIIRETNYIKGETDTLFEFIELDCDTVTETKYKDRIIKIKQPQKLRIDTIIKKVYRSIERTDKLRVKDTALTRTKENLILSRARVIQYRKKANKYQVAFYGLISILLLILFGRLYLSRFGK